MENGNYKVNRDDIYVGEVVKARGIYRYNGDTDFFRTKPGMIKPTSYFSLRSMLFVPNEKGFADDLLYQSPNYPILNITDDDTCLGLEDLSIVVSDACNLATLLEYYGYHKDLSFEDIVNIRKTFFDGRFAIDHSELFGFKEIMAEDVKLFDHGVEVTDPLELEEKRRQYRARQQAGHRMYTVIPNHELPEDYWYVLKERGDQNSYAVITGDAFVPPIEEGPVKCLKYTRLSVMERPNHHSF